MNNSFLYTLIICHFFLFFSCKNEEVNQESVVEKKKIAALDSTFCIDFGNQLLKYFQEEDKYSFNQSVTPSFLHNSDSVLENMYELALKHFNLYNEWNAVRKAGGSIDLLGVAGDGSGFELKFRGFIPPQEITYWEVIITGNQQANSIQDIYSYRYAASYQQLWNDWETNQFVESRGFGRTLETGMNLIDSAENKLQSAEYSSAWKIINGINASLYQDNIIQFYRLKIAAYYDANARQAVLQDWLQQMEKGSSAYWNYYFYYTATNQDYSQAEIAINNWEQQDPLVKYLQGILKFEQFQYPEAETYYTEALAQNPNIPDIHYAKVVCLVEQQRYVEAVESLLVMEDYFDIENVNWDKEFMAYPEFLVSDEFDQFLQRMNPPH